MSLNDKVALFARGAGDICFSIARRFLHHGAGVVLFDPAVELLRNAAGPRSAGFNLPILNGDVRGLAGPKEAVGPA